MSTLGRRNQAVTTGADYKPAPGVMWGSGSQGGTVKKSSGAIWLLLALGAALAFGQTDNTFYVKQFAGSTVGEKLTNAMQLCSGDTSVSCIFVLDPSLSRWSVGVMPSLCSQCSLADFRAGWPSGPANASFDSLTVNTNAFYVTSLVRTKQGTIGLDGNPIPWGNDLELVAIGAADWVAFEQRITATSSSTVGPGAATMTVTDSTGFYLGAGLTIDRYGANEETLAPGTWLKVDGTHISGTFVRSHTQPYLVDQWGAIDSKGHLWRYYDQDTGTELFELNAERSGANEGYNYTRGGKFMYRVDPNGGQPQLFGDSINGIVFYGSNGLSGSCANWAWRNNLSDGTTKLYLECSTGILNVYGGLNLANSSTLLSRYAKYTATLSPAQVAANTCAAQSVTVTGVQVSDVILKVQKIEQAGLSLIGGRATGANTVSLQFCNNTGSPITPTASESYTFVVVQ